VITRGCNQSANKIQSSELEPVITSRVPPYTSQYVVATVLSRVSINLFKNIKVIFPYFHKVEMPKIFVFLGKQL
jgi:hypothetical protein